MSTTRTNDNTQNPETIAKCEQATEMVREFLRSPYKDFTGVMYLMHSKVVPGEPVDVKIGQTSFRTALIRRTGCERTYAKEYTFYKQGRSKSDPFYGAERKEFDPLPDDELEQLKIDIANRNKKNKTELKVESFINEPHEEWETLYLASDRVGSQEYDCFPVYEGGFAFPHTYDTKKRKYRSAAYWEKKVQKVLKSFRNDYRITTTESEVVDMESSPDVLLSNTLKPRTVGIQNSSDDSERCTLSYEMYKNYINLFKMTCLELGGIPFNFTKDYAFRHQIATPLKNTKGWYDDFAAEQTKCFWEAIQRRMEKDASDLESDSSSDEELDSDSDLED